MREIINIQVGQCGNQVGSKFWKLISEEHGIDLSGSKLQTDANIVQELIDVYYKENNSKKFIPRAVLVDSEPTIISQLHSSSLSALFPSELSAFGQFGCGNNWGNGFYPEDFQLTDRVLNIIRKESECADCIQGFQLFHSLGGGSGSGMGALLTGKLREEYPDSIISTFSIFPSPLVSSCVVEPYNTILSLSELIVNSDVSFCIDNEAVHHLCTQALLQRPLGACRRDLSPLPPPPAPSWEDLNEIIGTAIASVTTSQRFPEQLNGDLHKLAVNMIPVPTLHFLTPAITPLIPPTQHGGLTTPDSLLDNLFSSPGNVLAGCNLRVGQYLTLAASFQGFPSSSTSVEVVDAAMLQAMTRRRHALADQFVPWKQPPNCLTSVCAIPRRRNYWDDGGDGRSVCLTVNSTGIAQMFQRFLDQFHSLFHRKLYVYGLTAYCQLEEFDFTCAESHCRDLLTQYQHCADCLSCEEMLQLCNNLL